MSDQPLLSDEQKLEMVRNATAKGVGAGDLGSPTTSGGSHSMPDMPKQRPATMDVQVVSTPPSPIQEWQDPPQGGGGDSSDEPLLTTYDIETGVIKVRGFYWTEGATGMRRAESDKTGTGTKVYLKIDQTEALAVNSCEIVIRSDAPTDLLDLTSTPPYWVVYAWVLIADVSSEGEVTQHALGNVLLGIWQIEGSVTRWPHFIMGSPPPLPEP